MDFPEARHIRREGRELELTVNGHSEEILQRLQVAVAGRADDGNPDAGRDLRGGVEVIGGAMNARLIKETRDTAADLWLARCRSLSCPTSFGRDAGFGYFALAVACVVMAGSSFGNEFQHRTISLLLSQPIARSVIWREKMLVLGAGMRDEPGRVAGLPGGCRLPSSISRVAGAGSDPAVRLLRSTLLHAGAAAGHRRNGGRGGLSVRR